MPAQDGAGWLLRLVPYSDVAMCAISVLITVYCLYVTLKRRPLKRLDGEVKLLLLFVTSMVILPVSLLLGIAAWFATLSILAGISAAAAFCSATVILIDD